jgi:S-adenosylmethionine hydrolase
MHADDRWFVGPDKCPRNSLKARVAAETHEPAKVDWPDDLPRIVSVDRYGNGMIELRASKTADSAAIRVNNDGLTKARTFPDRPEGQAFWYEKANGLVEPAVK